MTKMGIPVVCLLLGLAIGAFGMFKWKVLPEQERTRSLEAEVEYQSKGLKEIADVASRAMAERKNKQQAALEKAKSEGDMQYLAATSRFLSEFSDDISFATICGSASGLNKRLTTILNRDSIPPPIQEP